MDRVMVVSTVMLFSLFCSVEQGVAHLRHIEDKFMQVCHTRNVSDLMDLLRQAPVKTVIPESSIAVKGSQNKGTDTASTWNDGQDDGSETVL